MHIMTTRRCVLTAISSGLFSAAWSKSSAASTAGGSVADQLAGPGAFAQFPSRQDVVNVRAFGASGTGSIDDYDQILNARSAARSSGTDIHFPPAVYLFSATLDFGQSYESITLSHKTALRYSGRDSALTFDGSASGAGFGHFAGAFGVGTQPRLQATSADYGAKATNWHQGRLELECTGARQAALSVDFSVLSEYRIAASSNRLRAAGTAFSTVPAAGIILNERGGYRPTANMFWMPIFEGVENGIVNIAGQFNYFIGGACEGNRGLGYSEVGGGTRNNFIFGLFCEENRIYDFSLNAYQGTLLAVTSSSPGGVRISGTHYRVEKSVIKKLTLTPGAHDTVLRDVAIMSPALGGGLFDSGQRTRRENCVIEHETGASPLADWHPRPKLKRIGAMTITGVALVPAGLTKRVIVTIENHGLDHGDTFAISGVDGTTQLNGNSYQAEPIDQNNVRLLVGGSYVDGASFGVYSSAGEATLVPYASGWSGGSRADASFADAGFLRTADGMVHLSGAAVGGSGTVFILPEGFRPAATMLYPAQDYVNASPVSLSIRPDGAVTIDHGSTGCVTLGHVQFLAAQ